MRLLGARLFKNCLLLLAHSELRVRRRRSSKLVIGELCASIRASASTVSTPATTTLRNSHHTQYTHTFKMHQEKSIRSPNASCPARLVSATRRTRKGRQVKLEQLAYALACSLCLVGCLAPVRPVECGRLQDFIQNLVGGGGGGSSSSSSGSGQSSSASSSNGASSSSSDSSDSDTAASGEASNEQPMTPMMSAMNPFMRFPSY